MAFALSESTDPDAAELLDDVLVADVAAVVVVLVDDVLVVEVLAVPPAQPTVPAMAASDMPPRKALRVTRE